MFGTNYIVKYKEATIDQWNGNTPKSNEYKALHGRFCEETEFEAIKTAMSLIKNVLCDSVYGFSKAETSPSENIVRFYDESGNMVNIFYDFIAIPE